MGVTAYLLLHALHIFDGGVERRWMLLPGFFGHVKKAPRPSTEQELEGGEPSGSLKSLPNSEQHIGQEHIPILDLFIHDSLAHPFECLVESLNESICLRVVDGGL